jgi:hypothetical protein
VKITIKIEGNTVVLSYDGQDWLGNDTRITREFMIPAGGAYVREWHPDRKEWRQVCEGLATRGNALHSHTGDLNHLLAIIRREWRRCQPVDKAAGAPPW